MNIKVYGADWCSDCVTTKRFLEEKGVEFEYIIITDNQEAIDFLEKVNNGKRIIPTLDIEGVIYTNPGISGLMKIIK
ncbi:MAG: glutaredoxin family protein [Flavobacteriales bacterium]|jgi:thioredoxin reductase (NADPH)|tara:strand:+ start:1157 stop:1387 length:231 start_codon:yes stop_codon:yes gene_type:complete